MAQVLCYNHNGQLKAFGVNTLYPVGGTVRVQGLLLEEIYLKVVRHDRGGKYHIHPDIVVMMVEPLTGCELAFQQKASKWFSLSVFVSLEMLAA